VKPVLPLASGVPGVRHPVRRRVVPCNVVVRGDGGDAIVSFLDPQLMAAVTDLPAMTALADEATTRLDAALAALAG
jgi:hypothetical protein